MHSPTSATTSAATRSSASCSTPAQTLRTITSQKNGEIVLKGSNPTFDGPGKIQGKASGYVIKGSNISHNQ